ncbi:YqhR family membrane protein [Virgibacillus xinjiangensis]|uniref:YqhR family membrane protein n=1 Tax=Virgibacillus xinjiangensis TaxID=393090 RepID=A0ABV7CS52_9BACI
MQKNKKEKLEQNKMEEPMGLLPRSLLTGFIGGIFWSFIGFIMYYFNFTELSSKHYLLRSWNRSGWTDTWLGEALSILLVGLLSIVVALVYYMLLKKVNSLWAGAAYGIILWVVINYIATPIFENIPPANELSLETIISSLCLYILYGTFIGYSISYDYHETQLKKSD